MDKKIAAAWQYNGILDNGECRIARIMQIMKYPESLAESNIEWLIFATAPFIAY